MPVPLNLKKKCVSDTIRTLNLALCRRNDHLIRCVLTARPLKASQSRKASFAFKESFYFKILPNVFGSIFKQNGSCITDRWDISLNISIFLRKRQDFMLPSGITVTFSISCNMTRVPWSFFSSFSYKYFTARPPVFHFVLERFFRLKITTCLPLQFLP